MKDRISVMKLIEDSNIPKLFNLEEVSLMLDIPMGTLYNMSYRKVLPCVKIGKRIKLTEEHIKEIIAKGGKLYEC